jgi:hypothetical protein
VKVVQALVVLPVKVVQALVVLPVVVLVFLVGAEHLVAFVAALPLQELKLDVDGGYAIVAILQGRQLHLAFPSHYKNFIKC